jgi:hypothetical protein
MRATRAFSLLMGAALAGGLALAVLPSAAGAAGEKGDAGFSADERRAIEDYFTAKTRDSEKAARAERELEKAARKEAEREREAKKKLEKAERKAEKRARKHDRDDDDGWDWDGIWGDDERRYGPPASGRGLPPGLAKRDELPPGLAKRDELPPGLAKRELPDDLEIRLPKARRGTRRVIVGDDVVLLDERSNRVLDVMEGAARGRRH